MNGANWQDHFVSFNMQSPDATQAVSEQLPTIWAATYLDGYVYGMSDPEVLPEEYFDDEVILHCLY